MGIPQYLDSLEGNIPTKNGCFRATPILGNPHVSPPGFLPPFQAPVGGFPPSSPPGPSPLPWPSPRVPAPPQRSRRRGWPPGPSRCMARGPRCKGHRWPCWAAKGCDRSRKLMENLKRCGEHMKINGDHGDSCVIKDCGVCVCV